MKKNTFLITMILTISLCLTENNSFANNNCSVNYSIGGQSFNGWTNLWMTMDTLINDGDTVNIDVAITVLNYDCFSCSLDSFQWKLNGTTLGTCNGNTCPLKDTGIYTVIFNDLCSFQKFGQTKLTIN